MVFLCRRGRSALKLGYAVGLHCLIGCNGGEPSDTAMALPDVLGQCESTGMVLWSDVAPVFDTHCTSCHASTLEEDERQGAPVSIDYDQPDTARLNSELTWQLVRSGQMPIQGMVPFEDAMVIWEWLNCGGPE